MNPYMDKSFVRKFADLWCGSQAVDRFLDAFVREILKPGEVLDVGCGPGRDVRALTGRGIEVIGIDESPAMLNEARLRTTSQIPHRMFRHMDVRNLAFPPETFAGVWSCASFHHLNEKAADRAFGEIARVLHPDGVLFMAVEKGQGEHIDEVGRYRKLYERDEITSLLEKAGFCSVRCEVTDSNQTTIGRSNPKQWLNLLARKTIEDASDPDTNWKSDCLFCPPLRFKVNRELRLPAAASILWGDSALYVMPDVAPLEEGHLLIIASNHVICFGACSRSIIPALRATQGRIRRLYREAYGVEPIFIEHGPARCYKAGACINHAHFHCLPATLPVAQSIEALLGRGEEATLDSLREQYQVGMSYVYVEDAQGRGRLHVVDELPSQFLRLALAGTDDSGARRWQISSRRPEVQDSYRRMLDRLVPMVDQFWGLSTLMPGCSPPATLGDMGEQRIVRELIQPRFPALAAPLVGIGDDAAVLSAPPHDHVLVWTIDPCPVPVAWQIKQPRDYAHFGWMTAVVNLSDLAAMGATPLGMVVSTVMPEAMIVSDYERFLDGLAEACREWGCPVVGGNIKDGPEFTATGTALGVARTGTVLRRAGAKPGDRVCVVGTMGLFWAAVLAHLEEVQGLGSDEQAALDSSLTRPIARLREGRVLADTGQVSSCMDASDGISACLREIAEVNSVDLIIDADVLVPHPAVRRVAEALGIDHRKLMIAWGNWELVCTMPDESTTSVGERIRSLGTQFSIVGMVQHGSGQVLLTEGSRRAPLANFASERFASTSYFTHGLQAYMEYLKQEPLIHS